MYDFGEVTTGVTRADSPTFTVTGATSNTAAGSFHTKPVFSSTVTTDVSLDNHFGSRPPADLAVRVALFTAFAAFESGTSRSR